MIFTSMAKAVILLSLLRSCVCIRQEDVTDGMVNAQRVGNKPWLDKCSKGIADNKWEGDAWGCPPGTNGDLLFACTRDGDEQGRCGCAKSTDDELSQLAEVAKRRKGDFTFYETRDCTKIAQIGSDSGRDIIVSTLEGEVVDKNHAVCKITASRSLSLDGADEPQSVSADLGEACGSVNCNSYLFLESGSDTAKAFITIPEQWSAGQLCECHSVQHKKNLLEFFPYAPAGEECTVAQCWIQYTKDVVSMADTVAGETRMIDNSALQNMWNFDCVEAPLNTGELWSVTEMANTLSKDKVKQTEFVDKLTHDRVIVGKVTVQGDVEEQVTIEGDVEGDVGDSDFGALGGARSESKELEEREPNGLPLPGEIVDLGSGETIVDEGEIIPSESLKRLKNLLTNAITSENDFSEKFVEMKGTMQALAQTVLSLKQGWDAAVADAEKKATLATANREEFLTGNKATKWLKGTWLGEAATDIFHPKHNGIVEYSILEGNVVAKAEDVKKKIKAAAEGRCVDSERNLMALAATSKELADISKIREGSGLCGEMTSVLAAVLGKVSSALDDHKTTRISLICEASLASGAIEPQCGERHGMLKDVEQTKLSLQSIQDGNSEEDVNDKFQNAEVFITKAEGIVAAIGIMAQQNSVGLNDASDKLIACIHG